MLLRSKSGAWFSRSQLEIACLCWLPVITYLMILCPQDLFSPVAKRVMAQTGHLHTGLVCWAWITLCHADFRSKVVLLPWILLPWLLDVPSHWPVLLSAMAITVLQERLAHWLGTRNWLYAFIHLDLIWAAYRPLFFPKLANSPLFFGSVLAGDGDGGFQGMIGLVVSLSAVALPFGMIQIWHRRHRRQ